MVKSIMKNHCLPPGMRYKDIMLVLIPEMVELDKGVAGDVRTAKIMKEIANSVMPNVVQME